SSCGAPRAFDTEGQSMPLYEYGCRSCGHQFEAQQKMSDATLTQCPKCGADALERLVSKTSFTLKGSGWYADGYGSKADASKEGAAKESAPKEAKESTPKESGPKESAEAKPKPEPAKAPKPAKDSGD